jgi:hypothetical protein
MEHEQIFAHQGELAMTSRYWSFVACVCVLLGTHANAGDFFEPFDVDVPAEPTADQFFEQYPHLSVSFPGTVAVTNGILQTTGNGMQVSIPGNASELIISGDVGAAVTGDYVVGFVIGQNNIVFRPGNSQPPGGFAVEGPGGFEPQDIGFVPQTDTLHHFVIHQFPSGRFDVELHDGTESGKAYQTSFFNPSSVGGTIGFHRGGAGEGIALFDNLHVQVVPEASAFAFGLGVIPLLVAAGPLLRGRYAPM